MTRFIALIISLFTLYTTAMRHTPIPAGDQILKFLAALIAFAIAITAALQVAEWLF